MLIGQQGDGDDTSRPAQQIEPDVVDNNSHEMMGTSNVDTERLPIAYEDMVTAVVTDSAIEMVNNDTNVIADANHTNENSEQEPAIHMLPTTDSKIPNDHIDEGSNQT